MLRRDSPAELVVLVAENAFPREQIGPGSPQTRWLVCSVKVHHEMTLCRLFDHGCVPVHHLLVVALHEINLPSGDAPLLIHRECLTESAGLQRPIDIS